MRRVLTPHWSIDLDESFESRVVDGDLKMVSAGPPMRTVLVSVLVPPASLAPFEVLSQAGAAPDGVEVLERIGGGDDDEARLGHWCAEEAMDGSATQYSLYCSTARRGQLVRITFVSDVAADKSWALDSWNSLEFQVTPHPETFD
ncbi:hypothetical protein [Spelaeicoccus albus]|uniref:Uncharacterized protein n=1 Tax=Spelaeicoccus albus TaxID=1280376 RepID=A0A7Z0D4F4_9MICO|nr:hypothetical protein [Spelaeicoccus albus]NYI68697.1 hypothetical protein [Spelaeicoccus albus]